MATTKKILPLLLIGGAAYLAFNAYNASQALGKLSARGGRIKKITFKGLTIDLELEVSVNNPGSTAIPFEYYTGTITHAGSKISDFSFDGKGQNIVLAARSVTPVAFTLSIGTINIVYKLIQLVKAINAQMPVDTVLQVTSSVYAAGIDMPVNFTHDLRPGVISGFKLKNVFKKFKTNPFLNPFGTINLARKLLKKKKK